MKIIVTSTGDTLDAAVDERFGRARAFFLWDTETREGQGIDNTQNLNAMQGAGIQAAQQVADLGAQCVITGQCGPKAFRTLQAAGIAVYTGASGSVGAAIERFESGAWTATEAPTNQGHMA